MTMSVTPDMFDTCCEITAQSSKSLATICSEIGCTYKAMRYYIDQNDDTRAKYAQAKEDQADWLAEEMLDIADDDSSDEFYTKEITDKKTGETKLITIENKEFVNRSKLKVDTRKWIAEHLKPKKWGQKIDITTDNQSLTREIVLTAPAVKKVSINPKASETNNNDNTSH